MCAALKVTRQGYYAWKSRTPSAHADQLDPLDAEGILALRSISQSCAGRIGDAARILEAQNKVLYAKERTPSPIRCES